MDLLKTLPSHSKWRHTPTPQNARSFVSQAFLHEVGLTETTFSNCSETDIRRWSCQACTRLSSPGSLHIVDANSNRAFVTTYTNWNVTVIFVRGTKNVANAISDVNVEPATWPKEWCMLQGAASKQELKMHKGFFDVWLDLREGIQRALGLSAKGERMSYKRDPRAPSRRVLLVGHSLGAAAAIIGLMELFSMGLDVLGVVAFESPLVFNRSAAYVFQDLLGPLCLRLTNYLDPVPHVPAVFGYTHVGLEMYFDRSGAFHLCDFQNVVACRDGNVPDEGCHCSSQDWLYPFFPVQHCKMPAYLGFNFCECDQNGNLTKFYVFQYLLWLVFVCLITLLIYYLMSYVWKM